jgi:hypothetical protein
MAENFIRSAKAPMMRAGVMDRRDRPGDGIRPDPSQEHHGEIAEELSTLPEGDGVSGNNPEYRHESGDGKTLHQY